VGVAEYARLNTGVRITRGNSANGVLHTTGRRITHGRNANNALAIGSLENGENK